MGMGHRLGMGYRLGMGHRLGMGQSGIETMGNDQVFCCT